MSDAVLAHAPLSELRLGASLRRYERVKLAIMVAVLIIVSASGAYLIGISRSNHQSLVILQCAVARSTQVDSKGHQRTPDGARREFDRCVAAG